MIEQDDKKIDYQFVPVPTELAFALDPYCLKAITVMMDKENYWKSRSKLFQGYFTLSVEELAEYLCLENRKDARLTLEALYRAGLIDVKTETGKRFGAKVKLNWDEMKKDRLPNSIEKLPRTESLTYCADPESTTTGTTEGTYCTVRTDNNDISIGTTYSTDSIVGTDHNDISTGTTESTYCTTTLEQEIERDIEKEQEIDKEQRLDIEQEPREIETSPYMTFEEYLQSFIERYPYINYSYPPDTFYDTYFQELMELQTKIREDTGKDFTIKALSIYVYFYKKTGKVYE